MILVNYAREELHVSRIWNLSLLPAENFMLGDDDNITWCHHRKPIVIFCHPEIQILRLMRMMRDLFETMLEISRSVFLKV